MSTLQSAVLLKHSCTGSVTPSVQTETVGAEGAEGAEGAGWEAFRRPIGYDQLCCKSLTCVTHLDKGLSGHQVGIHTLCPRTLGLPGLTLTRKSGTGEATFSLFFIINFCASGSQRRPSLNYLCFDRSSNVFMSPVCSKELRRARVVSNA